MLTPAQSRALAEAAPDAARTVFAPYRICLVGAHIDHQGGTVTGFAIGRGLALAYSPAASDTVHVTDAITDETVEIADGRVIDRADGEHDWTPFVRGAATLTAPRARGLKGALAGSLPSGGLSSSAALSVALLSALADTDETSIDHDDLARLAQRVENEFVGVNCGLMDPTVILHARRDHLVALDCSTEEVQVIAGPPAALIAVYSGLPRSLKSTGFNSRTEECREAAIEVSRRGGIEPPAERLGDLPRGVLEAHAPDLPPMLSRRARHYLGESARVEQAIDCWRAGDLAGFGRCASESLQSSVELYETGSPEQTVLAEMMRDTPGVHGARFCGGGFGGFVAGICDPDAASDALDQVVARYRETYREHADRSFGILSRPSDGRRWL
ncbi:MAG: hypothetical protein GF320_22220 [Armatimonadia bacterium]|nr:hypothetical protein [Armatimonadia bacterium]